MQKITNTVIVLSPHLDDAVLSCIDTAAALFPKSRLLVLTIFSAFRAGIPPSNDALVYIQNSGYDSVDAFEKARKKEDIAAMHLLGHDWFHLDNIDAGFRVSKKKHLYPKNSAVFSGRIEKSDTQQTKKITQQLTQYKNCRAVFLPAGIGNHVDHLLVRNIGEKVFTPPQTYFYFEYPYTLKLKNLYAYFSKKNSMYSFISSFLNRRLYRRPMTNNKLQAIKKYKSQYRLMFSHVPNFQEIVIKK